MKGFEKGYKLPLDYDGFSYVWDVNRTMCLQFEDNNSQEDDPFECEFRINTVSCINTGKGLKSSFVNYDVNKGIISIGDNNMLIRGWGYLTGTGGLNLTDKEASEIQDSFAEYIVKQLSYEKDR